MDISLHNSPIAIDKVPPAIFGTLMTQEQKEMLSQGQQVYLKNIDLGEGRPTEGKISFVKNGTEPSLKLLQRRDSLEIPKVIMSHVITDTEIFSLNNQKLIPIQVQNKLAFLELDKDLNLVVVRTPDELNLPKSIGDYILTDKDKALLANKESLPNRVYLNSETNTHFLASVKLSSDGTRLQSANDRALEAKSVSAAVDKYNKEITMNPDQSRSHAIKSHTITKGSSREAYQSFEKNVQYKNFSAIKDMTDKGFTTTQDQVEQLTIKYSYSRSEQESLQASVSISKAKKVGQELSL